MLRPRRSVSASASASACPIVALASFAALSSLVFVLSAASLSAQEVGGHTGLKENLDLPFNTDPRDEEDVVVFYATQLEGDAFFYVVDRSSSMHGAPLELAKKEISRNILEFSDRTRFGVVFFDNGLQRFPDTGRPMTATPRGKTTALAWIHSIGGGQGSCMQQGLLQGLSMANKSGSNRSVIVYVGDGGGTCGPSGISETRYLTRTRNILRQQNYLKATVNFIGLQMHARREMQRNFMKLMAFDNGGSYREI